MAKKLIGSAVAQLVVGFQGIAQWFNLHAFDERNSRHDSWGDVFSDLKAQIEPLKDGQTDEDRGTTNDGLIAKLLKGWDALQQAYVEVTIPTKSEVEAAIAQRRERLANWRGSDKPELGHIANFVERYWFPNGEPCPVLGIVNMAYRRMRALPGVVYARNQRSIDTTGQYGVPVLVREYANPLEAYLRHVDENLGKDAGRKTYGPLDYVRIAKDIAERGGKESHLRKYGKVGEAQRSFRFITLHNRYPDVRLYERVMREPSNLIEGTGSLPYYPPGKALDAGGQLVDDPQSIGSYIPFRAVDKEALARLLNDKAPNEKDKPEVLTAERLEAYAEYVTTGGSRVINWNKADNAALQETKLAGSSDVLRYLGWLMANAKRDQLRQFADDFGPTIDAAAKAAGFDLSAAKEGKLVKPSSEPVKPKSKK